VEALVEDSVEEPCYWPFKCEMGPLDWTGFWDLNIPEWDLANTKHFCRIFAIFCDKCLNVVSPFARLRGGLGKLANGASSVLTLTLFAG
jgi:hypothetical protein